MGAARPGPVRSSERTRGFAPVHDYWLYTYDKGGRLLGAPVPIRADDDETAIVLAEARVEAVDADLMDGDRLVKRITHDN